LNLLKPETAADVLAVSRSTVLRMIADGSLPAICLRAGRKKKVWRIRQEHLEKWVLNKEKDTAKKRAQASTPTEPETIESSAQAGGAVACQASAT
jgi:excisionase family DNA binding protein